MPKLDYKIGKAHMAKKDRKDQGEEAHYSAQHTAEEAAAYIDSLAAALRKGSVMVETNGESLQVSVGPTLTMDMRARTSGGKKSSIRFRMTWSEPEEAPVLSISSSGSSG
jgi:amphi-Trp domain-containing protein